MHNEDIINWLLGTVFLEENKRKTHFYGKQHKKQKPVQRIALVYLGILFIKSFEYLKFSSLLAQEEAKCK